MNATTAIANHLNIVESLIDEVQEWANVLFVKFTTGRPRFVSKKVVKVMESDMDAMYEEYLAQSRAQDAWIDQVDEMVGKLGRMMPLTANPTENVLQRIAADVVDGKISEHQALQRLTNKKIIIRR